MTYVEIIVTRNIFSRDHVNRNHWQYDPQCLAICKWWPVIFRVEITETSNFLRNHYGDPQCFTLKSFSHQSLAPWPAKFYVKITEIRNALLWYCGDPQCFTLKWTYLQSLPAWPAMFDKMHMLPRNVLSWNYRDQQYLTLTLRWFATFYVEII